jgi:parallel beta-helix repeat protein
MGKYSKFIDKEVASFAHQKIWKIVIYLLCFSSLKADTIFSTNFDSSENLWPYVYVWPKDSGLATLRKDTFGTIDSRWDKPSNALEINVDTSKVTNKFWVSGISTGMINSNGQANCPKGLFSIQFDLFSNRVLPVTIRVKSFSSSHGSSATGTSERKVYPNVQNTWIHYSLDLDTSKDMNGIGFDPSSPYFEITLEISGNSKDKISWPSKNNNILRLDNIHLSTPKYYVSNWGHDNSNGSFNTPFKTIQHALNEAVSGDMIVVRGGEYTNKYSWAPNIDISVAGKPEKWIMIRNYPNEIPTLKTAQDCWNNILFNYEAEYIELRGFEVVGLAETVKYKDALDNKDRNIALYNSNGINIDSRLKNDNRSPAPEDRRAHHIRIIGNKVHHHSGAGISALESDYITIMNNEVYENSHWTRFATSGINIFHAWNFHSWNSFAVDEFRMFIIHNNSHHNRCFVPWGNTGKVSDGNGIILDDFINSQSSSTIRYNQYNGKTLVQNNISHYNGGSGMHAYKSNNIFFVNNTAFMNNQSPELNWGQIFSNHSGSVRIYNNIIFSDTGREVDGTVDSWNIENRHNQYYRRGGLGIHNMPFDETNTWKTGNWKNAFGGDFRLKSMSPAINSGNRWLMGSPIINISGDEYNLYNGINRGAY